MDFEEQIHLIIGVIAADIRANSEDMAARIVAITDLCSILGSDDTGCWYRWLMDPANVARIAETKGEVMFKEWPGPYEPEIISICEIDDDLRRYLQVIVEKKQFLREYEDIELVE